MNNETNLGAPTEPTITCPETYSVIKLFNDLRQAAGEFKTWGDWWRNKALDLNRDYLNCQNLVDLKQEEINELRNKVANLGAKISELKYKCERQEEEDIQDLREEIEHLNDL